MREYLPVEGTFLSKLFAALHGELLRKIYTLLMSDMVYVHSSNTRTDLNFHQIIPLAIIIGLFVPLPFWFLHKKWPKLHLNQLVTPMICTQMGFFSSASAILGQRQTLIGWLLSRDQLFGVHDFLACSLESDIPSQVSSQVVQEV